MSTLFDIILILMTLISITSVGIMIWYVRKIISKMSLLLNERRQVFLEIRKFAIHLNNIHELPLFYGDDTIGRLLAHSKDLLTFLEKSENDIFTGEQMPLEEDEEEDD